MMEPSPWIRRFGAHVSSSANALDLACGVGRNGRWLMTRGIHVTFLDRNITGIADLSGAERAEIIEADIETGGPLPIGESKFNCVVVTNYLWRANLPNIFDAVAPNGILIYETFGTGNEAFGRPRNPDFLLQPQELLNSAKGIFHILAYEHGQRYLPSPAIMQRLAAIRK